MKPLLSSTLFVSLMITCLGSNPVEAQTLYNNGAVVTINAGGSITVKGSLTNATSSTLANSGTLNVTGNTVNNGTINTASASALRLQGTSAQTLGGTSPINVKDVIVDNAAGVIVNTPLNVDGTMTFTNGITTATNSSYPVTFTANGSVGNTPTNGSHIDGYVQKQGIGAFTFPIGNATNYQPVGVNLSANSAGMTARYFAADPGAATFGTSGSSSTPLLYVNRAEYWELAPSGTATGTVTVYFDSYKNSGITSTSDLRVAHKSGGQWLNEGGSATGTTSAGSVTSNSISTFSPFTLGSISSSSPLPVKMIAFDGKAEASGSRLNWRTATEDAGTTFVVERSSSGVSFESLGEVAGKGNNGQYTFYDQNPVIGDGYYRLAIHDADGTLTYSNVLALRHSAEGMLQLSTYPVPATRYLNITRVGAGLEGTIVYILDAQGRSVIIIRLKTAQTIDVHDWPAGVYTLRTQDGNTIKISKQ